MSLLFFDVHPVSAAGAKIYFGILRDGSQVGLGANKTNGDGVHASAHRVTYVQLAIRDVLILETEFGIAVIPDPTRDGFRRRNQILACPILEECSTAIKGSEP